MGGSGFVGLRRKSPLARTPTSRLMQRPLSLGRGGGGHHHVSLARRGLQHQTQQRGLMIVLFVHDTPINLASIDPATAALSLCPVEAE
jgi:hypothetical protein